MRGGKREGSGRKPDPSKQIRVNLKVLEKLEKVEGKTWSEKIRKLLGD